MLILCDGPSGWLVKPCMVSFCRHQTEFSHQYAWIIFYLWEWFNRLVNFLIVGFKVRSQHFPISINQIIEKKAAHESKESGVLILQLLEERFFSSINDLILEGLICCAHILIYHPYFIVLKLVWVLVVRRGIQCYCGVYSWVRWVGLRPGHESCIEHHLHIDADMPMVYSSLWFL